MRTTTLTMVLAARLALGRSADAQPEPFHAPVPAVADSMLAPLLLLVPLVTLANCASEVLFAARYPRRVLQGQLVRIPVADPLLEVTDIRQ